MAEFPSDYLPPSLDDLFTAADVAAVRPPSGLWGYNIQVTDEALSRIAQVVTERDVEIAVLRQQLAELRAASDPAQRAGGRYPALPPRTAAVEQDAIPPTGREPARSAAVSPAEPATAMADAVATPAEAEPEAAPPGAGAAPAEAEAMPPGPEAGPAEAMPPGPEAGPAEAAARGPEAGPAEAEAAPPGPEAEASPAGAGDAAADAGPEAVPAEAELEPETEADGEPAAIHGAPRRHE